VKSREGDATSLRDASFTDLPRLQEIERQAGEVFRAVGMNAVADDEPLSVESLRSYVERGQAWVIADHVDVCWATGCLHRTATSRVRTG